MSREQNVDIARRAYEAALRTPEPDIPALNALFHPDHEFVSLLDPVEGGSSRGGRGFRDWLRNLNDAFDVEIRLEDVTALDDERVLAITETVGRGRRSGVPVEERYWSVATVRDGKVARTEVYSSREQALASIAPDSG
jgi:ketosteroid isomerase-like protein